MKVYEEESQMISIRIQQFLNESKTVSNYIEKYVPVKLQRLIYETLSNILPTNSLEKLKDIQT